MRNLILLAVLVSGLLGGYFIGDLRGKAARVALAQAVETGKALEAERQETVARLKADLDAIKRQHDQALDASRKENEARAAQWQLAKANLDDTLKRQTAKAGALGKQLADLSARRDGASGAEKERLGQEVERLRQELERLQRERNGNACLSMPVPASVISVLNGAKQTRSEP